MERKCSVCGLALPKGAYCWEHPSAPIVEPRAVCHCLIWHPSTPEERAPVVERLARSRRLGDKAGITLALAQLTGECPAR